MLCKYGFKGLVFIFPWLLLVSCSEKKETDIFTLSPKSREALIQEGYKSYQFRIGDEIDTFDNILLKAFDDTVVKYVFQDDVLERRLDFIHRKWIQGFFSVIVRKRDL